MENKMVKVAIAYHSGFGHTKKVAESVKKGVSGVAGVEAILLNVEELKNEKGEYHFDDLNSADGIIFGCPTYMG